RDRGRACAGEPTAIGRLRPSCLLPSPTNERPALLGAGRGIWLQSSIRLRPPLAPIGGSRRIQVRDGVQPTVPQHVEATQTGSPDRTKYSRPRINIPLRSKSRQGV